MGGCVGLGHRVDWFVDVEPVGGEEGPLPHDISRTTRADVCALGVNALFPDNVTHIQDARRNTLGASPSAKGGRFSLQRRFNCSGGPSGDAR